MQSKKNRSAEDRKLSMVEQALRYLSLSTTNNNYFSVREVNRIGRDMRGFPMSGTERYLEMLLTLGRAKTVIGHDKGNSYAFYRTL